MFDDSADELLVDLAADQPQDLAPFVVAAVLVEEGDEAVNVECIGDVELMHEVGGANVLQKRAMHESVGVRADEAEDEVALPELLDHRSGRGAALAEVESSRQSPPASNEYWTVPCNARTLTASAGEFRS